MGESTTETWKGHPRSKWTPPHARAFHPSHMSLRPRHVATALALSLPTTASPQSIEWKTCEPAVARARCGTITLPEARDKPGGRQIEVAVAVLPATDSVASTDPVLFLLGGPGGAAVEAMRSIAAAYAPMNRTRDMVFVDQRGTGRSAALRCPFGRDEDLQSYLGEFLPMREMEECRTRLAATADLTRYRTRDFIADLEAVRAALGVPQWNLHATSYGTRVALHYLQRHPSSVRSAILASVVPPELTLPMTLGADADSAIVKLTADCRADSACAATFPRFREELDSVAQRLERAPASVALTHPTTDQPITLTLTRGAFGEFIRSTMYSAANASALPLVIFEAYRGDYGNLVMGAITNRRGLARGGNAGLYLAITCAEDVARVDATAALTANRRTTMGESRAREHIAACRNWPTRPDGEEWPTASRSRVPVLLMVGDTDPATPPHWARLATRTLGDSKLVVVPGAGHLSGPALAGACLGPLQVSFVAAPEPGKVDASCVAAMRRPAFILQR